MNANTEPNGNKGARSLDTTQPNARTTLQVKLKRWRKRGKLTQDEARRHLGVPIGTYRNWEQGRKPPGTKMLLDAILARIKEPAKRSHGDNRKTKASSAATARG